VEMVCEYCGVGFSPADKAKSDQRFCSHACSCEARKRRWEPVVDGDVAKVPLTRGEWALVDLADLPKIQAHTWFFVPPGETHSTGYAKTAFKRRGQWRRILLHRLVLGAQESDLAVDHINGNGLDNRRCNLRLCTLAENQHNRKVGKNSKSGYNGVAWDSRRMAWRVRLCSHGARADFGVFKNKIVAGLAANIAIYRTRGPMARLNILKEEGANYGV
jgi:hypothetical protein